MSVYDLEVINGFQVSKDDYKPLLFFYYFNLVKPKTFFFKNPKKFSEL